MGLGNWAEVGSEGGISGKEASTFPYLKIFIYNAFTKTV